MNSAPEDFGSVRRLLALKRHELPPPGYFNEFPRRVIARLEREQSVDSATWFGKLVRVLQLKPVFASGLGIVALGILAFRLVAFQQFEPKMFAMVSEKNVPSEMISTPRDMVPAETDGMALNQIPTGDVLPSSVNPAINTQPPSALFAGFHLNVQTAAFRPDRN